MVEAVVTRAEVEADLRRTLAQLAALPARRQWDIEGERTRLRAEVETLLDRYNHSG